MAPSYDNLQDEELIDEDDIDFTDLREQYEVRLEEGLDTFVVVDGLPKVPADSRVKLTKFLLRKLNAVGTATEEGTFMPLDDSNTTLGFAFVEFSSPKEAVAAIKAFNGTPLDKKHTIAINKLTDIDRYGREGRVEEEYVPPTIEDFQEREHLRWWLSDPDARDQFVMFRGDNVGVFWNEKDDPPEVIVDRPNWTEMFVQWSPLGTYLTSIHQQGVQIWAGKSWTRQRRFAHPFVNLIDFSPNENYLVTWSHRPIAVDENNPGPMSMEEDGKNYIIWDVETGKPLRSFVTLDIPGPPDENGEPTKKKLQWPAFKWSADDKYVARMTFGQSISVYETPRMNMLDKASIKIEGVQDFEWAPATAKRESIKTYEQLLCYWTPELGSNPAKVGLMTLPSKEIVRTRNLFNVSDAKLHWQSQGQYLCVKVDRHSKSKKSLATNLEIFRIQEKGVPVEVVDSLKDTVINFAWEPKGDRFVLITAGEIPQSAAVPPKTSVVFFCPEKAKGNAVGNFKHIRTIEKKNSNAIYWSPRGRFVVIATVHSQQSFELDFWDMDFEGEKDEKDKDLTANLQLMNTAEHYGITDAEWDPTGRFVATSASIWKHTAENGYHLYDFKGTALREEPLERFKQFAWRPRPPTLLTKEEQKHIRRNLREYSKIFDPQDLLRKNKASRAIIEQRRRLLDEWLAWREQVEEELHDEVAAGLPDIAEVVDDGKNEVIEEIVEEIIDETEEIIA
ncbi:translation initiation factor eIF-3b [Eremomyces bilateralis CBS 781.70]|uniref:Eukaryotic translation initiation factor 3 subunit B n=1 Tax=Eremomyces bilateralis CBS 781.70 TaxID=1392243 RepID=A0A6G1GC01_9PEZI|nr:translation initiation factor eIF-3b [Eremomyces bilateralis CBS 781.70]KAF1815554.1 translation initiation factor eIF-3b [Eremomyces bilateralis CBS 781.70]